MHNYLTSLRKIRKMHQETTPVSVAAGYLLSTLSLALLERKAASVA